MTKTIFFTSDTHFDHKNLLKYDRSFSSIEEMNEQIILNWNSVVKPNDDIYHLGDLSFCKSKEKLKIIINRLHGNKILIRGNHDREHPSYYINLGFKNCFDYKRIDLNKKTIILSHYPMIAWDKSHFGSWLLYGHCHGKLINKLNEKIAQFKEDDFFNITGISNKMLDVGQDGNNFFPYSYENICEIMERKEN